MAHNLVLTALLDRIAATRSALLQARREALAAGTAYQLPDLGPLWWDAAEVPEVALPPWTPPRSGLAVVCLLDALDLAVRRATLPAGAADQDVQVLPVRRAARTTTPATMSATEAAQLAGVSRSTWWSLHAAGKVPVPVKVGGRTLWRSEELRDWIAAGCPDRRTWEARMGHRRNSVPG